MIYTVTLNPCLDYIVHTDAPVSYTHLTLPTIA